MATNNATNTSNPVTVAQGGTGDATLTAYAVLAGGTTTTAPVQSLASVGTTGQFLVSNGAAALPTFQTSAATAAWNLIRTATASTSANITFTSSDISSSYIEYMVLFQNISNATGSVTMNMDWSTNNGGAYLSSGYLSGALSNAYNSTTMAVAASTTTSPLTPSITNTAVLLNARIFLQLPPSASSTYIGTLYTTDTTSVYATLYGANTGTTTINNIRFSYSSGNITAGTISLYGLIT